ncbi:Hypothetical protein CRIB_496 [Romboutsia ilealis]|uniref:Uncharacterized protein n=1 Tax=Romboutsia ilealis TaxID=1115758 RepID=A0A1V1HZ60_9FIRM|nr:Hypothetical protein CRIB_496 [Romboutsia ilealis]
MNNYHPAFFFVMKNNRKKVSYEEKILCIYASISRQTCLHR